VIHARGSTQEMGAPPGRTVSTASSALRRTIITLHSPPAPRRLYSRRTRHRWQRCHRDELESGKTPRTAAVLDRHAAHTHGHAVPSAAAGATRLAMGFRTPAR
jgi:hypothetical protein